MSRADTSIAVNPAVLKWARESAGYSLDEVEKRFSGKKTSLIALELGQAKPTVPILNTLANLYHRPLAALLLPKPPVEESAITSFRQVAKDNLYADTPELRLEIRKAVWRRLVTMDLTEDKVSAETLKSLRATARLDASAEAVAGKVRQAFGWDGSELSKWNTLSDALRGRKSAIENLGVLIFQTWNLEIEQARGLALTADPFPVILLNSKDADAAKSFTAFHELGHILLNSSNGNWTLDDEIPFETTSEEETWCNNFSVCMLMPKAQFLRVAQSLSIGSTPSVESVGMLAKKFHVSRLAALWRLKSLTNIDPKKFQGLFREFKANYLTSKASGGSKLSSLYRLRNVNGDRFSKIVLDAYHTEKITSAKVCDYLNIRIEALPSYAQIIFK